MGIAGEKAPLGGRLWIVGKAATETRAPLSIFRRIPWPVRTRGSWWRRRGGGPRLFRSTGLFSQYRQRSAQPSAWGIAGIPQFAFSAPCMEGL